MGLFFPSLHPQEGDGGGCRSVVPKRMVPYPRQRQTPPRRGPGGPGDPPPPPSSSPGTVGFRLRLPKGVTEVSIPFAKAGGKGRVIVWRGGDPSGAALC